MITLVILVVLLWQFFLGYTRGFIKQVYEVLALLIGFMVAGLNYQSLADQLTLWVPYSQATEEMQLPYFAAVNIFEMDRVFYAGLAYALVLGVVYGLLKLFSFLAQLVTIDFFEQPGFRLTAGALSVLVTLLFWSVALRLLATIPLAAIQGLLSNNWLIKGMINFPILSQLLDYLWVVKILG